MKISYLKSVWFRFSLREKILALVCLIILILGFYLLTSLIFSKITLLAPKEGGKLRIGEVGKITTLNPLLIQDNDVERDISEIIYSGLFKIDGQGHYLPDLAQRLEISPDGKTYDVYLKENVFWQDGEKFSADDVIFTLETITDPLYRSPLRPLWLGIKVQKLNDYLVRFELLQPYNSFISYLTLKIIPKHLWSEISPENFVLAEYSLKPIGTGPYRFLEFQKSSDGRILSYTLARNQKYFESKPYISTIVFKFYKTEDEAISALLKREIDCLSHLSINKYPLIKNKKNFKISSLLLPRYYAIFFNQGQNPLLSQLKIRQALELAIDKSELLKEVLNNQALILNSAISQGFLGFDEELNQKNSYNPEAALSLLKEAGLEDFDGDHFLEKKDKNKIIKLEINLTYPDNEQLDRVAQFIKKSWENIGLKTNLLKTGLDEISAILVKRNYEALIFGNVYGQNPDLYAFWHSSQVASPGLNLNLYRNAKLDSLLEESRQTNNEEKRVIDLLAIQKIIDEDKPAIFLYNPYYLYIYQKDLKGNDKVHLADYPSEQFSQINKWYLYQKRVLKIK